MEKLSIIGEEHDDWVLVNNMSLDAEILDKVQVIYCDTRDFAITWSPNVPKDEHYIASYCTFFQFLEEDRDKYVINKKDILKWINKLCEEAGGYEYTWRFLSANLKECTNWDIKYIRFVRNNKNPEEFIVCNSYFHPIEYREIIKNLNKSILYLDR